MVILEEKTVPFKIKLEAGDKRANTIKVYEVCYKNYLSNAFNKMIIDDITENHIQNLIT